MTDGYLEAIILGILEGLTEFLPVSSTGHLILASDFLHFDAPWAEAFQVMIQLGAILAVCVAYIGKIWRTTITLPTDAGARNFAVGIVIAFLPAAILGALFHDFITSVLFSPWVVCAALFAGGIAILVVERILPRVRYTEADRLPIHITLGIGLCQTLSLVPGVSRAGATIIGALLLGVERKAAAEFSFFLAVPTMLGAFVYDAYANWDVLAASSDAAALIAVGFVTAFLSAMVVVRTFIAFVGRYGFGPFAWYRIIIGFVMTGLLIYRG
jgi:undecaprenyl-diphosphatase